MSDGLFAAIGTILGAILGALASEHYRNWLGARRSRAASFPDLRGKWRATWFTNDSSGECMYVQDRVEIERQRGALVFGRGEEPTLGRYDLRGQFNYNGVITFTYVFIEKATGVVGGVVLRVSADGKKCEGVWHGYTKEESFSSGRAVWERLPK